MPECLHNLSSLYYTKGRTLKLQVKLNLSQFSIQCTPHKKARGSGGIAPCIVTFARHPLDRRQGGPQENSEEKKILVLARN
jgi:hypothetical protein